MQQTGIEYLTHTWNPIRMRCTPVSEGCKACWHLSLANRLSKNPMINERFRAAYVGGTPVLDSEEIQAPLHHRKPSIIGVQFMGDLFHEDVKFQDQLDAWLAIELCPRHTFLCLTKRPENASIFFKTLFRRPVKEAGLRPLSNLWLGVTAENQEQADKRIPILLQTPAAHRFVSIEPMLGGIYIERYFPTMLCDGCGKEMSGPPGKIHEIFYNTSDRFPEKCGTVFESKGLDAVILGGETGPGARPIHPDWVRSVRDQCQGAGVPFFFKQWGEWLPVGPDDEHPGSRFEIGKQWLDGETAVFRVGHKKAGRELDGRTHDELPWKGGMPMR